MTRSDANAPLRILVVDDDELDRVAVRRCFQQAGLAVTIDDAASAAEALERIRSAAYDCVLLDYYLPGVVSSTLLYSIRELAHDLPVVIFTGRGDEEIAVELMKAGAVDYIPKASLTPERLATSIRYALEMGRAAKAHREAEQALREREAEFRTLANAIPQLAWIADTSSCRYWYNQRWYEYTGLRPDESLGLGWQLVYHPDDRARAAHSQEAAFKGNEVWEETVRLRRKDGEYRSFLTRAMPVTDDQDIVLRWFGTDTDITERLESERAIAASEQRLVGLLASERQARAEAERAAKARDEVLAIVAHDLRNPMHTVMAAASMLALTAEEDRRQRQVGIIQRSVTEMERLIADLLDVARIESGTLPIRAERVDVRALIDEAFEMFEPQAQAGAIALDYDVEENVPPVAADRDRLIQVLSNLLGNALKFTPAGRQVTVRAGMEGNAVHIAVKDSGMGIPAEDLPHIFDRFWQANRASRAGAGLGLAICKGIVEAHGGRIWAASAVERGTTFHFTLPAADRT